MKTKNPSNNRIYCVVASTVQVQGLHVVQPLGRQVAQAAHVVSKVRVAMARKDVLRYLKMGVKALVKALHMPFAETWCPPITTIVLEARDSFELFHVFNLLNKGEISTFEFFDTEQPDYGDENVLVRTAIATEPVSREDVEGILDYLPLWGKN